MRPLSGRVGQDGQRRMVGRWLALIVALLGMHAPSAAAERAPLSFQPPDQPVTLVMASKLTIADNRTNKPVTVANVSTNVITFSRNDTGWWAEVRIVSVKKQVDGGELIPDPMFSVPGGLKVRIQLSPNGQAQHMTAVESLLEQLNAQEFRPTLVDAATIEQVALRAWNSSCGAVWAIVAGQDVEHGTSKTFAGHLQLGLLTSEVDAGVDGTPLRGKLTIPEDADAPGSPFALSYEYAGELTLDGPMSDGLTGALKVIFPPSLGAGHWTMSRIAGKGQASLDRKTLLIRQSTLQQQMTVTGEHHATLHLERQVQFSMTTAPSSAAP